jgi:hypothetical protein
MPETGILSPEQQVVFDPIRTRVLQARGVLQPHLEDEGAEDESYGVFEVDFKTVGEFYHKIETGFTHIPEEELFIGPPEAQANARFADLNGELVSVVDSASARAAIEMIVEQGEAPTTAHPNAHFWVFDTVRTQYAEALAHTGQTGIPIVPVRPVVANPMTHFYDDTSEGTVIHDPLTHKVADTMSHRSVVVCRLANLRGGDRSGEPCDNGTTRHRMTSLADCFTNAYKGVRTGVRHRVIFSPRRLHEWTTSKQMERVGSRSRGPHATSPHKSFRS